MLFAFFLRAVVLLKCFDFVFDHTKSRLVFILKIVHYSAALRNNLKESTARMVVFGVFGQMTLQLNDLKGKNGYLNLRRAGITALKGKSVNYKFF